MKKLAIFILASVTSIALHAAGPKIKLKSGSLSALSGVKEVGLVFDYSNMRVGKMNESAYLEDRTAKYNAKEPGKGDQWAKAWVNDREARFEPKFIELINKNSKLRSFQKGESNAYFKVHTIFTEPGFNVGVARANASVNMNIHVMVGGSEVAVITIVGAYGGTFGGYDFDTGTRIAESYAVAGKYLGKFLDKKAK